MKFEKQELIFSFLLIPVDAVMLFTAGLITWYLRFRTDFLGLAPAGVEFNFNDFLLISLWLIPLYILFFAFARLYKEQRERRYLDEVLRVILGVSTGTLALIVILFFGQEADASRFMILAAWLLAMILVIIGRYAIRMIVRFRLLRGKGVHKVVVIGDNETSHKIRKNFRENPQLGVEIIGVIAHQDVERILKELKHYSVTYGTIEILQTDDTLTQDSLERILDFVGERKIKYKFTPSLYETQSAHLGIGTVAGIPIIELKATLLEGWGRIGKRTFDIAGSVIGIIMLSPILLALAVAVKMDSKGPIFYRDPRVNRDKKFALLKFRSMIDNADEMREKMMHLNERSGPLFKIKNDPRITRVGRFTRKTSLDELPQLFNVLKGDMSLVGPRPHRPDEIVKYKKHHRKLLTIKPGITGLAATSGRSDLEFEEEVRLDTYYIEYWSFWLDLKILVRTFPVVLSRKSAV